MAMPKKSHFQKRLSSLEKEQSSFTLHWKELSDYISPRKGRFFTSDRNKGEKRNKNIINSHATLALRTLTSGMMSGITSPARPWFRLGTSDTDLMEVESVKEWLSNAEKLLMKIFSESNLYPSLQTVYKETGLFGTGAMTVVEDFEDVIRVHPHTIGSYYIAQNDRGEVDTFYRKFQMTVGQIVLQYGLQQNGKVDWSNISTTVRTMFERGAVDSWIDVVNAVEFNDSRKPEIQDAKNKKFRSVHYEVGSETDKLLSESGFDEFPVMVSRWDLTGNDIYGSDCPGMMALGDVKDLQLKEKRKAQAIDKMVNPPLKGPAQLKNIPVSSLPGGLTLYDQPQGKGLESIYDISPGLGVLLGDIQKIEGRIDRVFFVDLFTMLANLDGIQPRNVLELSQRKEEKLLQLGPVLERTQNDVLDNLIDRTLGIVFRNDMLPPPPEELQGQALNVDYISTLAQAQQAVGTATLERIAGFVGNLAGAYPEVLDKMDPDQVIDEYSNLIGVAPNIIRSDDKVDILREERAQQQQRIQQMAVAQQGAETAKLLSETETGGGQNALTRMTGL